MEAARQNFQVQKWITVLSVFLFIVKLIAYYQTQSLAILTDALESIVNVIAGFIGLYSLYVAAKPKDIEHPYGHGKAEFVSAAAEGGLIIAAGILIIYQTILNFIEHKPIQQLEQGSILVAITAVINYIAGYICLRIGKRNNSLALKASGKHLQTDTYSTLGIIVGLVLIIFTKLYWLDKAIALIISFIIIFNGYKILRSSLAGIMDEADMKLLEKMIKILNENRRANWMDIHNLRVIKYGPLLHLDCHLTVPWYFNVVEGHKEIDALKALIEKEMGDALEMFVHTDACIPPEGCAICIKTDCPVRESAFSRRVEWTLGNILSNKKHTIETKEMAGHFHA